MASPRNTLASLESKWCPEPNSGCWLWTEALHCSGYGWVRWNGRPRLAHRVMYECMVGPVPSGLELDHRCRTRSCVNPEHMEPVTHAENVRRGESVVAERMRATHCKHGHPLERRPGERRRRCMTCHRRFARELDRRRRAK